MIERLKRYVAIPSVSRQEGALADVVAGDLLSAGLRVQRHGHNVWCELGDAPRPRLLLNSHLDTVPPGQGWSADPWIPVERDGGVVGLGANDAKGCAVAMLEAALALKRSLAAGGRLGGTIVLALTAEEEISGQGLGSILERLVPLDAALVGEPTGMTPMIAQRGLLILKGLARGRSGHPANTPMDGDSNAILTAAGDLARLADFDWGPPHPLLGRCHAHVTRIQGGIADNVVPDACEFLLDVRTTPMESHRSLYERLRSAMRSELSIRSERLAPVETAADAAIVRAILRALPAARPAGSPAMSDMVFLSGVPAVKIGPGDTRRSHTPDEFVAQREIHEAAAGYERIVREYFAADRITAERAAARGSER
ncbi:MAG: M20/M25/M40 family metallo-hydrolase [Phycisphaerae bacterium]|jgi:acetylornithine deacetylase